MDYVTKINTKRDMRCLELPYVIAEGGSRLRARFASLSVARNKVKKYVENRPKFSKVYKKAVKYNSYNFHGSLQIPSKKGRGSGAPVPPPPNATGPVLCNIYTSKM